MKINGCSYNFLCSMVYYIKDGSLNLVATCRRYLNYMPKPSYNTSQTKD